MLWILHIFIKFNKKKFASLQRSTISLKGIRQLIYHKCAFLHQWITYCMHTFPHGFNSHTGTHSQYLCMHTRTHFGPISLQLLIAVVHLLYDEVGSRVLSQVVVVVYHPAPLGVPLLLPVHAQQ